MLLFPQDYYQFNTIELDQGGNNDKSDVIIDVWVQEALEYLENHPEKDHYSIAQGNTKIIVLKYPSEIQVIVAKNFWEKNLYPNR